MSKAIKVYKKSLVSLLCTLLCSLSLGCADAMIDLDQDDDESKGNHSRNDHNNEAGETSTQPVDLTPYYEILGVKPGASLKEIERACRNLRARYHIDKYQQREDIREKLKVEGIHTEEDVNKKFHEVGHAAEVLDRALNIT